MSRPSLGKVLFDGKDLYALGPGERARLRADKMGFVFQTFQLIPYLNTLENVLVPALAGKRDGTHRRAEELLERLGLRRRAAHRPAELSAGERQRVALARAMLREPDVLLADEPTGNLDAASAEQVMDAFAGFQGSGGTVIMVTHDERMAARAGRVVHLSDGQIQGSPTTLA
jgi:putative ABC transport system ATP-binding protein